ALLCKPAYLVEAMAPGAGDLVDDGRGHSKDQYGESATNDGRHVVDDAQPEDERHVDGDRRAEGRVDDVLAALFGREPDEWERDERGIGTAARPCAVTQQANRDEVDARNVESPVPERFLGADGGRERGRSEH